MYLVWRRQLFISSISDNYTSTSTFNRFQTSLCVSCYWLPSDVCLSMWSVCNDPV